MQDGLYCKADAVLQGGCIARWLMLQGVASGKGVLQGRMPCCKAGVLQGGWCCKVLQAGRECCKVGREHCKVWMGKDNMMLQYLPVIHTTANHATPPNGRDRK